MNFYISDLHLGHKNCLEFDNRPFSDVEEMDRAIIERWNNKVCEDDNIYIIGDFAYRNANDPVLYLKQLKGHKHLVIGNHDYKTLKNKTAMAYFDSIDKIMYVEDILGEQKVQVICCHFPIASWYNKHHGSYHVFGHIHNSNDEVAEFMSKMDRALNAGCMINNYTPMTLSELIKNKETCHFL